MSILKFGGCMLVFGLAVSLCQLPEKSFDFPKVIICLACIAIAGFISKDDD